MTYLLGNQDHWQTLLDQQRELEDEGMARGAERFRRRLQHAQEGGRATDYGAARRLLSTAIEPLEKAIAFFIEEQKGKRGIKHCAVKWIEAVGVDVAAYMTIKALLDRLSAGDRLVLRDAALPVVGMIQDELRFRRFQAKAPGLFKYRLGKFSTTSYAHMARSLNASADYAEIDMTDLEIVPSQKLLIGTKLIDLFIQSTGLVELQSEKAVKRRGKRVKFTEELYLVPTQTTVDFLQKRNSVLEFMAPVNLPMIVPPLQWAQGVKGGYRFAQKGKYEMVRAVSHAHADSVASREMPEVFTALNAIQNTAWRINKRVLATIVALQESGGGVVGIPTSEQEAFPPRPADYADSPEIRKHHRFLCGQVKERNHLRHCRVLEFSKIIAAAERMKDFDAFFFPHNLDFRGRIYPITTFLSPQGDDLSKGMLTFAQGKPLGSDGARWLAIHGCNQLGETPEGQKVSKMTLDERVAYIEANSQAIESAALDPVADRWWTKAEDPLQFLAFCFEWANYLDWRRHGIGQDYVCSLPVSQDGSCNGLQHFSAMLRDEKGGRAVNLIPGDRPQDVYDEIRERATDELEERALEDNTDAQMWLRSGLVTRKLTKRPTMTFSYGSKPYGFQQQIAEYLLGHDEWNTTIKPHFTIVNDKGNEQVALGSACALLSQAIWHSLRDVVVAAFFGMEWLQKCAREVVKTGKPVEWTVPLTGFRVRQEYFEIERKEIRTTLAGRIVKPRVYSQTDQVQGYKQANAVAPNVVHSLDAAALMLTMAQCAAEGVENFAAVHDSYGTLPADMGIMARATRQSFVKLYQTVDVVEDLRRQFVEQAGENGVVPPAPAKGTLDVSQVQGSDYFFC